MVNVAHSDPARKLPPWGVGIVAERLALLAEHERAEQRAMAARVAGDGGAIEQAERGKLDVYGACAIHRAAVVNDSLAALRMMCEDDPGTMAQYLAPIVLSIVLDDLKKIVREMVLPVAQSVARLEAA